MTVTETAAARAARLAELLVELEAARRELRAAVQQRDEADRRHACARVREVDATRAASDYLAGYGWSQEEAP